MAIPFAIPLAIPALEALVAAGVTTLAGVSLIALTDKIKRGIGLSNYEYNALTSPEFQNIVQQIKKEKEQNKLNFVDYIKRSNTETLPIFTTPTYEQADATQVIYQAPQALDAVLGNGIVLEARKRKKKAKKNKTQEQEDAELEIEPVIIDVEPEIESESESEPKPESEPEPENKPKPRPKQMHPEAVEDPSSLTSMPTQSPDNPNNNWLKWIWRSKKTGSEWHPVFNALYNTAVHGVLNPISPLSPANNIGRTVWSKGIGPAMKWYFAGPSEETEENIDVKPQEVVNRPTQNDSITVGNQLEALKQFKTTYWANDSIKNK